MCVSVVWRSPRKFDRSVFTKLDSKNGKKNTMALMAPKNGTQSGDIYD